MPRERALKLKVADGIREVKQGVHKKAGNKAETDWFDRNRLGTEPYVGGVGGRRGNPASCPIISFGNHQIPNGPVVKDKQVNKGRLFTPFPIDDSTKLDLQKGILLYYRKAIHEDLEFFSFLTRTPLGFVISEGAP